MEQELLKEILESYEMLKAHNRYYYDRGKGTKSYCINRIRILRDRLLDMQKEIQEH